MSIYVRVPGIGQAWKRRLVLDQTYHIRASGAGGSGWEWLSRKLSVAIAAYVSTLRGI
jgi:hypothetical protein